MDAFELIKDKQIEFQPRFGRMDKDRDLINMLEYRLKGRDNKPMKNVNNVTMNDAKVFFDKVSAFMSEASMSAVVTGRHLKDTETSYIENFDEDMRYEIDQSLMPREIHSLYNFLIEQSCARGILGARFVAWENEGKFSPDILPCDTRYLLYEYGDRDLEWGAYPSVQTKLSIETRYPNAQLGDVKKGKIWDYWDKEKNQVWLGGYQSDGLGQLLKETPNIFGYVPYIIEGVGSGSMLQDEGAIEHQHESIFAPNRNLHEQINMLASILQTLNFWTFAGPSGWESEAGVEGIPPTGWHENLTTVPVDKGTRGLFPFQIQDVKNSTRIFYALLMGAIQRGSLPNVSYGNLTFPMSAVGIAKLKQGEDAIFWPRLQAIALFYQKLHYMVKDQYVKGGYQAELGERGMERIYFAKDLNKKYAIKYQFFAVSPEQDIANYAVAAQARAIGMSQHTIFTDVLKLKNPKGEIMKRQSEDASQLDPVLAMFDYGHALIDQQEYFKAELIKDKIKQLLRQRYMPQPTEEPAPVKGTPSPPSMLPLLEGGGGGGQVTPESDLETQVPEEALQREERRGETVRKQQQEG